MRHTIIQVNDDEKTGVCTVCGPVKIRKRSDNKKYRCWTSEQHGDRKRKYGLAEDEYLKMFSEQGGRCAICQQTMASPHVDHDHNTGRVRGLLCSNCNTALGLFGDNTGRLARAIGYLNGNKSVRRLEDETSISSFARRTFDNGVVARQHGAC